jgi:alpha,alpha-trehalase
VNTVATTQQTTAPPPHIENTRQYIRQHWDTLTRTLRDITRSTEDEKLSASAFHNQKVLYIPQTESVDQVQHALKSALPEDQRGSVHVMPLPDSPAQIKRHSLLYLPHSFVVPGGRYNEMYGWDSYFIQLGLMKGGRPQQAKDLTDNFLYQVKHYGKVLNANRSYYLERSQPPFLADMVLNVYRSSRKSEAIDQWLRDALPVVEKDHAFWTTGNHLDPKTGLSRYFAEGEGASPEVAEGELDEHGLSHYDRVKNYFKHHDIPDYRKADYYDAEKHELTPLFFKADRTMRESGYDPSNRFGPFNADILNYTPVDLNCLLVRTERNIAEMHRIVGRHDVAQTWEQKAKERSQKINALCWDKDQGMYFDYNTTTQQRRLYPFATTFFPLWCGVADAKQAQQMVKHLDVLEAPGGIRTSANKSGNQWDAPFGWAPLQLVAVDGLHNYGYHDEAKRIATKFTNMVANEFAKTGHILEKYDVEAGTSNVEANLKFGFVTNEVGFGWTNGVFEELVSGLYPSPSHHSTALKPLTPPQRCPWHPSGTRVPGGRHSA